MSTLWQKKGTSTHPAVHPYIISPDLAADNALLPFDVQASVAHAQMLGGIGLLEQEEVTQLEEVLHAIAKAHAAGDFVLQPEHEDVHTAIERALVERVGEVGKKIHTGRSRNDQVLVAMRLFMKDALRHTQRQALALAEVLLGFAKQHAYAPMPGFTHMQHAMPSSVGQWSAALVESLLLDEQALQAAYAAMDRNPLGSAAGFGTAIPLDREATTKALGFGQTQISPIFCQNSRGKLEAYVLHALVQVMMSLGKLANDMVVFCSQEFGFFTVDASFTTGSSIMPQKRNLDVMEVMRANVSVVQSLQLQVQTVGQNLISGYSKDLKITKKAVMDGFSLVRHSLQMAALFMEHVTPNEERLKAAFDDVEIFAADETNARVLEGKSFRDAYKEVGESLSTLAPQDVEQNLRGKTHLGATGNLGLARYEEQIAARKKALC